MRWDMGDGFPCDVVNQAASQGKQVSLWRKSKELQAVDFWPKVILQL